MKKFLLLSILAIAIFATSLSDVMAQVPKKMNYQASLLDDKGKPLSGNPSITFKIYDAETGGTELWNEVQNVTPVYGFINVELGANTPIELPFDQQYWLEITVAAGTPFPRTPLLTTPYSFRAGVADSAKVAAKSYLADQATIALGMSDNLKKVTGGDVTGTYPVLNFDDTKLLEKLKNGKISQDMLNPNITFPPSGPAYGDLTGFYPGPAIAAGAVTNIKLANDAVTTEKILNGTILNEDLNDPNYTIFSNDNSLLVPGALVLGQDFNLQLNLANSNTWTAKQHFNGGFTLFGHDFNNPTTAGQVYVFDGTNWVATGAQGDVTGLFNALRVEKLWNMPLNGPGTAANQLYIFDGAKWNPGLIMNANVAANAAIDVTKLAAGGANQFLVNDGTTNKWAGFAKSTNFVGNGVTSALELSTTGVTAGTYGSSYQVPMYSVDVFGRLSFAGNTVITAVGATTSDLTVANGAINNLDLQLKVGVVGSPEILDGSIQNIDIADPNYTITSNGSITVPGALVLGQDYALTLNMANSNTWTATQNFNAGLTGSTGVFSGIVSALQFNGALQYKLSTGDALQTASFNNTGNTTFNVLYDGSTIGINGANRLYVPTGGITTTQILDGTILAADLADNSVTEPKLNMANLPQDKYVIKWNNTTGNMEWADASVYVTAPITGNGTSGSPLGLAYQTTQLGLNGTNQLYIKTGAITSTEIADLTIVDADIANGTISNGKLVNSSITLNGGNGLTNGGVVALGGSLTFDVNVDNSSIEINADALRVKDNGITEPKLAMANLPADKYVIKWNGTTSAMEWADASVYVTAPITGNGTMANPLGLAYDASLELTAGSLGIDLDHSNTWTAAQNFNGGLTGTTATLTGALNGTTGTFSGIVTASQFNGALQYGVSGGNGISNVTFNNTGNIAFDVNVDNSTIQINADALRVKAEGITANEIATGAVTTDEILNGTILNADMADPNYTITSNGSVTVPGALVLGQDFALSLNMANTNTWTAVQNFNGGLTSTTATLSGALNGTTATFSGTVTANQYNGALQYAWTAGEGLTSGSFNNSANKTFNVLYDNSTIGINSSVLNQLYVKAQGITTLEIKDGTVTNTDMADPNYTITSNGSITVPGALVLGQDFNLQLNMANTNTWTAVQNFNGGLTGTTATLTGALVGTTANFSGNVTTAGTFNGLTQYGVTAGYGLLGGTFNNSADRTFDIDESTNFNWTGNQTWAGTSEFNGDITHNGFTVFNNSAQFNADLAISNTGTFVSQAAFNLFQAADVWIDGTDAGTGNAIDLYVGMGSFDNNNLATSDAYINGNLEVDGLAYLTLGGELFGGEGLNSFTYNGSADVTVDVLRDGSTISLNGSNQLYVPTGGITTTQILDETILASDIATGAVTTSEILNGTILNEDMADPNYTITSNGSITVPGALVLGQDFNLQLNMANTNTWTAVQNFNGGLTGTTGTFSGVVSTAATFNGNLQYGVTGGVAISGGTFNNSGNRTFDVRYDNSTIGVNGSNNLYVPAQGITTLEIKQGTILNEDIFDPNYTITSSDASLLVPGALVLGQDFNLRLNLAHTNHWTAIQYFDAGLEASSAVVTGDAMFGTTAADLFIVNSTSTFNAPVDFNANITGESATFAGTVTANQFNGNLQYGVTAGYGLLGGTFKNDANHTFTVDEATNFNWTGNQTWAGTAIFNGNVTANANVVANGNTTLGNANTDVLTVNATSTFNANVTNNANTTLGDANTDALTVNATSTFTAPISGTTASFSGVVSTAATFNGNLQYSWIAGEGLTSGSFNNSSNKTFNVLYDNSTIGLNGSNQLYVKAEGITNVEIKDGTVRTNEILDETILAEDIATGAVRTQEILNETILAEDIATGAVETSEILNETILAEDIATGAVTTDEILNETILSEDIQNGTILNEDIFDPNYNVTSTGGSMIAPGALVLGQDFNIDFDLTHTNDWVAVQNFNGGLTGLYGTFTNDVTTTGGLFIGNLQRTLSAGEGLTTGASFNNSANVTFNVLYDNSTIGLNGSNQLYVPEGGITTLEILNETILAEDIATGAVTTDEILNGTILNEDIADPMYSLLSADASMNERYDYLLGEDIDLSINMNHTNDWVAVQNFNGGLTADFADVTNDLTVNGSTILGDDYTVDMVTVNSMSQFNGDVTLFQTAALYSQAYTNQFLGGPVMVEMSDVATGTIANDLLVGSFAGTFDNDNPLTNDIYTSGNLEVDGTLFGVDGNFSGKVDVTGNVSTGGIFIGNLENTLSAGEGLTVGATFNNSASVTFDVLYDNSTIGLNVSNQLYVPEGGITTLEILDGTILNDDIADPNYTITSGDGSLLVPGALVLGQDFDLALDLNHTNTWTAVQNFDNGLTGLYGTFTNDVTTTGGFFVGDLQNTLSAGEGLSIGASFNNSANTTFDVLYDNSTIGLNLSNELYVPTGGITTTEILDETINEEDLNIATAPADLYVIKWDAGTNSMVWADASVYVQDPIIGDGTFGNPLGLAFDATLTLTAGDLGLDLTHTNTWTAVQNFDAGLTADYGTFTNDVTSTGGFFIGSLQNTLTAGEGLTIGGTFNNSANATFDVLYDNSTIGLDGLNQLYVPTGGITTNEIFDETINEEDLNIATAPALNYVIKWDGSNMIWADASVYVEAPIHGDGTFGNELGLDYDATLQVDGLGNLGIALDNPNFWGAKQVFTTNNADAAVEVTSSIDQLAFTVSQGKASFTGGEVQVNYSDNSGSTNPLFIVQQTGLNGGGMLVQSSGDGAPALDIWQTEPSQPAVRINQGSVVMSNTSYAADDALNLEYTVHAITGGTTFTVAAGTDGQFIYVINTTGAGATVDDGTNIYTVNAGTTGTFVCYGGLWYKVN